MLAILLEIKSILLPLLLFGLGSVIVIVSLSQKLAWKMDWPPEKLLRLLPIGLLTVAIAFAWLVLPGFSSFLERPDPPNPTSSSPTPTPLPPPFIDIQEPHSNLNCQITGNTCWFRIHGTFGGAHPLYEYRIYTFVFPTEPQGPGYYLQDQPATLSTDGSWTQPYAAFGNRNLPAAPGHKLTIQAALVDQEATYNGQPLAELPPNFYLGAVELIEGLLAVSEPVALVVE